MKRLLILGGTADARQLAADATGRFGEKLDVITSWAGRTGRAPDVAGRARVGGFGGAAGLEDYIKAEEIAMVIDATHPFAETISMAAHDACLNAETPRLLLERPPWQLPADARWVEVDDLEAAAEACQRCAERVFLTTGKQTLDAFAGIDDIWFLVRLIDPPAESLPITHCEITTGRPPFTEDHETQLMREHRIDVVVSKAAGGPVPAKITSALALKLPIILIAPPAPPPSIFADTIEGALTWIETQLA